MTIIGGEHTAKVTLIDEDGKEMGTFVLEKISVSQETRGGRSFGLPSLNDVRTSFTKHLTVSGTVVGSQH